MGRGGFSDPGVVIWGTDDERWYGICQVCKSRASHETSQQAIDTLRRHLITAHLSSRTDVRNEPRP